MSSSISIHGPAVELDMPVGVVQRQLLEMLLGEHLGVGTARHVYRHAHKLDWVVKIETVSGSFQNVIEWDVWGWAIDTPLEQWLAPCTQISSSGAVLIQERTTPVARVELPERIPKVLSDTHLSNWGRLDDGRIVCHDYGKADRRFDLARNRELFVPSWREGFAGS